MAKERQLKVPAEYVADANKVVKTLTDRRVGGLNNLIEQRAIFRKEMDILSKQVHNLNENIKSKCTHSKTAIEAGNQEWEQSDTMGNNSTTMTRCWLRCTDCGKQFDLEKGFERKTPYRRMLS